MHINMYMYIHVHVYIHVLYLQFFHCDSLATPKDTWPKIEKLGNPFLSLFLSALQRFSLSRTLHGIR